MTLVADFLKLIINAIFHFVKSSSKINKRCSIDDNKLSCHVKTFFCKHRYKSLRINSTLWIIAKCLIRSMKMNTSRYIVFSLKFSNVDVFENDLLWYVKLKKLNFFDWKRKISLSSFKSFKLFKFDKSQSFDEFDCDEFC